MRRMRKPPAMAWIVGLSGLMTGGLAARAQADPVPYHTLGEVWPWQYGHGGVPGVNGPSAITFQGISNGILQPGAPFELGQFVVSPLPDGVAATYTHTAFTIEFDPDPPQNDPVGPNDVPFSSLRIEGELNGTVTGGQSTVQPTFLSVSPNLPLIGSSSDVTPVLELPFAMSDLSLLPPAILSPAGGGSTAVMGVVATGDPSVPEPGSALLLIGFATGFGLWHRWGRRR
jgi:hypothetical protein